MAAPRESPQNRSDAAASAIADCPLNAAEQKRNVFIFAANTSLIYLGAPGLYIGLTQAALFEKLEASKTLANLPSSVYFCLTPLPIIFAWYFCATRMLKPVLTGVYLCAAALGAVVTAALLLQNPALTGPASEPLKLFLMASILAHAAVVGGALGTAWTFQWEMLARGVSLARRGAALSLAFGVGPIFACCASLAQQFILNGVNLPLNAIGIDYRWQFAAMDYPWNFACVFGSTVPLMVLASFLSTKFVVPQPAIEVPRLPFVKGVFGGLGEYLSNPVILLAALSMVLVASGYSILNNISLFTKEALGSNAEHYVGVQNALRFGFKVCAGLSLGSDLTKTFPKVGMLVTAAFCLASALWVLLVPGWWFLFSFALMGAGELFGVYYPNYITCCSPNSKMRRNLAFTNMLNMPAAFAPVVFGKIADKFGSKASFYTAIGVLVVTILLVLFALPNRPHPRDSDLTDSDRLLPAT